MLDLCPRLCRYPLESPLALRRINMRAPWGLSRGYPVKKVKFAISSMLTGQSTTIWDISPTQIHNSSSICRVRSLVRFHGGSIYATFPEKSPSRKLRRLEAGDRDVLFPNWGDWPNSIKRVKKTSILSFCTREKRFDHHFLPISKSHRLVDGPQK